MLLHPRLIAHRADFEAAFSHADAMPEFDSPIAWAGVCAALCKLDAIRGFSKREELAFSELTRHRGLLSLRSHVEAEMRAANICAAFAARRFDLPRSWPIAAWACTVKAGPDDRMGLGLLRACLWMGFDPDARDDGGHSAMDLMLGAKRGRHCHPRGARVLLESGADPDAVNADGDTPLLSLARSEHWCEDRDACARLLIAHGADALAVNAEDSLASLLREAESARPARLRAGLLAELRSAFR